MPTRRHRKKRVPPPPTALDRLNAMRAAGQALAFGHGTREAYEEARRAWEIARDEMRARNRERERELEVRPPPETRSDD